MRAQHYGALWASRNSECDTGHKNTSEGATVDIYGYAVMQTKARENNDDSSLRDRPWEIDRDYDIARIAIKL